MSKNFSFMSFNFTMAFVDTWGFIIELKLLLLAQGVFSRSERVNIFQFIQERPLSTLMYTSIFDMFQRMHCFW